MTEDDDPLALPTCRVLAAVEPDGVVRFEASREYIEGFREMVEEAISAHEEGGFVTLRFVMHSGSYAELGRGFAQLVGAEEVSVKQVVLTNAPPEVAIEVVIAEEQARQSAKTCYRAFQANGPGHLYGQEFAVSRNGAEMLIQQIDAALAGHETPMDAVDTDALTAGGEPSE